MNAFAKPEAAELAPYYQRYVDPCTGENVHYAMLDSLRVCKELFARIPPEMGDHRYATDKWTIKDVLQHMIDTERIFAYRALRFARNDATPLPGFEENEYAQYTNTSSQQLDQMLMEMEIVRGSTILLFQSFDDAMLLRKGTASNNPFSVRALGWIIAGHMLHHVRVIEERYLAHAPA